MSNFTWDWICDPLLGGDPRYEPVRRRMRDGYGRMRAVLKLPFGEVSDTFPERIEVPLVAGRSTRDPYAVRGQLGIHSRDLADEVQRGCVVLQLPSDGQELARLTVARAEMAIVKEEHMHPRRGEARDVVLELLTHARCAMRHYQSWISTLVTQSLGLRWAKPGAASNSVARKLYVLHHHHLASERCRTSSA
jgi:hypothetical protein